MPFGFNNGRKEARWRDERVAAPLVKACNSTAMCLDMCVETITLFWLKQILPAAAADRAPVFGEVLEIQSFLLPPVLANIFYCF